MALTRHRQALGNDATKGESRIETRAMSSDKVFISFVCEQLRGAGEISSRRLFGEAAIYLQDKVVGLVCDNQLFVKPTDAGRAKIGVPLEAPPFPGANNWFLQADLDDPEFLAELIRTTADALPVPKVKTKNSRRAKSAGGKRIPKGAARRP
jgi:TfoX/Sxy family transcriptional regulator of competence genes